MWFEKFLKFRHEILQSITKQALKMWDTFGSNLRVDHVHCVQKINIHFCFLA